MYLQMLFKKKLYEKLLCDTCKTNKAFIAFFCLRIIIINNHIKNQEPFLFISSKNLNTTFVVNKTIR